ncbi:MAG TPA: right-handed parallel beta-helix repeat-containing protein [Dehalococcoidia bacterium]|nr:right-handed parallel beta-helix repeat-containing protein [Dehalococcoidia bacterium]
MSCSIWRFTAISMVAALALVFSLATVIIPASPAQALNIEVMNTNDSGLGSLRQAIADSITGGTINFSDTLTGSTITLTSGQLTIDKSLTITGPGEAFLEISGNNTSRVFYINQSTVDMSGMTIRNGNTSENGGGLYNNGGNVTMTSCNISENEATDYGGGIYRDGGDVTLTNCTVSDNTAYGDGDGDGGGIFNRGDTGGGLMMTSCTVSGNYAEYNGGGIYNEDTLTMTNCTVSDNTAYGDAIGGDRGGGIYNDGLLTMTSCNVSDNTAGENGGGIYNYMGNVTMTSCTVSGNTAEGNGGGGYGGGIYNFMGNVTMTSCTVSGNTAVDGGGLHNKGGNVTMTSCTISENEANSLGGGIYRDGGDVTMTSCTVSGNTANQSGGGIFNGYEDTLTMTSCTVSGNTAEGNGGGGYGGGIYNYKGNVTMTSCNVSDNTAQNGGGIYNYMGNVTMTSCTISGNTASYRGGGIDNEDEMTMTDCTISGNIAADSGGGIFNGFEMTMVMVRCTVSGNTAGDAMSGGGIFNNGELTMTNCTVSGNTSDEGGGIYNIGNLTMINCTISDNTADEGGGINNDDSVLNLTMTCTIVYGNTPDDIDGGYTDAGENIVGDPDGDPDPLLGQLRDNGGPTFTHALGIGSLAIDGCTGGNCTVATDQRGVSRPQGDECDIGAYEVGDCCDEVATATATGTVELCVSSGVMENLTAVGEGSLACPEEGKPNLEFTHGFLSFNVTGFTGDTVTINITLPQAVPVGTEYWKCQNNTWVDVTSLLGDDDGDNVLTLTITDGGLGDADGTANWVIEEPGAPAQPGRALIVGGEVYPVDRLQILMPWLGLAALMALAMAVVVIMKRRRTA